MKLKLVTAACAVLCSGGAFAATAATSCNPTTLAGLVNTCAPEVTFFVGGASAQQGALEAVLAGGSIIDSSKIRGKITVAGNANALANGNTLGYIGYGATGTTFAGKRVLVVYNKANGSAAGVTQLLTAKGTTLGTVAQNEDTLWLQTVTTAQIKAGLSGSCTVATEVATGTLGAAVCSTVGPVKAAWGIDKQKAVHMALSDVRPIELSPGIVAKWDQTKFPASPTGMQGFGVIVNPNLYSALIAKNIADGALPSSCSSETIGNTTDTVTAACQPSISRADYASIITGKITTAAGLLGSAAASGKTLNLFRRVSTSGTQASSNIFFAGQAAYNSKAPTTDGFADIKAAGTYGDLTVVEGVGTGNVIGDGLTTGVSGDTTNYSLGVVSLENVYSKTKSGSKLKGAAFVKVDGMSPNFTLTGDLDSKHRVGMQTGYPFAFEMQALKPAALAGDYVGIFNSIVAGLTDPANNLSGVAYINSSDAAKNTSYTHNGNNYLPLSK